MPSNQTINQIHKNYSLNYPKGFSWRNKENNKEKFQKTFLQIWKSTMVK